MACCWDLDTTSCNAALDGARLYSMPLPSDSSCVPARPTSSAMLQQNFSYLSSRRYSSVFQTLKILPSSSSHSTSVYTSKRWSQCHKNYIEVSLLQTTNPDFYKPDCDCVVIVLVTNRNDGQLRYWVWFFLKCCGLMNYFKLKLSKSQSKSGEACRTLFQIKDLFKIWWPVLMTKWVASTQRLETRTAYINAEFLFVMFLIAFLLISECFTGSH